MRRGNFTSVADLETKLRAFLTYFNQTLRIPSTGPTPANLRASPTGENSARRTDAGNLLQKSSLLNSACDGRSIATCGTSSVPASSFPARHNSSSCIRSRNKPCPHWSASCGCPSRPVSHRCVPVPAVRTATRDRPPLAATRLCNPGVQPLPKPNCTSSTCIPGVFSFVRPNHPFRGAQYNDVTHIIRPPSSRTRTCRSAPAQRHGHRAECAHRLLRTPGHSSPRPSGPRSVDRPLAKTPRESAVRALPNGPDLPPTAPSIPTKPSSIQPGTDQPFPPVIERTAYSVHPRDSLP